MKEIRIEIPEGKEAKWMNGVLTLVDEKPKDITERVKTFEDALKELGEENVLVQAYRFNISGNQNDVSDVVAYLKLRIIVSALNEGWEPKFTEDEHRYFPWFYLYTKEQYDKLGNEKKGCYVLRSSNSAYSVSGFVDCNADYDTSYPVTVFGSRLAFRTRELAAYAGRQFIKEWANFLLKSE